MSVGGQAEKNFCIKLHHRLALTGLIYCTFNPLLRAQMSSNYGHNTDAARKRLIFCLALGIMLDEGRIGYADTVPF